MSRLILLACAIGGTLFARGFTAVAVERDDSPKRYEYTCKEGQYKAIFPSKPITRRESAFGVNVYFALVEDKSGAYTVAYTDRFPGIEKETDAQLQKRLDDARNGMLRTVKARLVKEERIKFEKKYPGREVLGEVTNGLPFMVRNRIYIIDGRLYQVMVVGTKSFLDSDEAKAFSGSFWLTK